MMEETPKLTCTRCKRRKIRCDKLNPCSACETVGVACEVVQRARLPRGRSANARKSILDKRLSRLEDLLTETQNQGIRWAAATRSANTTQLGSRAPSNGRIGQFVAPEFWEALTEEIAHLRQTLEESGDEEDLEQQVPIYATPSASGQSLLFGSASCICGCTRVPWPAPLDEVQKTLQSVYRQRVDCLYKILHWPTVLADIERLEASIQEVGKLSSLRALIMAIYFMAMCSITSDEATQLHLGDRAALINHYRHATERAISEANLLQQPNLITLQAFVIYLLGLRTCNNSAISWTLLATAVRIGTAMRLGQENDQMFDPLELQLRRRLWYFIALLDTFASLDRGTAAMLRLDDLGAAPLILNDKQMSRGLVPKASSPGFNDMSFFALTFRAMCCQKRILSIPDNAEDGWTTKVQLVSTFEQVIKKEYIDITGSVGPLERFAGHAAASLITSMNLILRRPPYKQSFGIVPPSDGFDVLQNSTKVLQYELDIKSVEFAPWAWKSWVHWYALAIVLAELCSQPPGETYERAYVIASRIFKSYSTLIADNDTGTLWKPIAKLMGRVQAQREGRKRIRNRSEATLQAKETEVFIPERSLYLARTTISRELANAKSSIVPMVNDGALHTSVATTSVSDGEQSGTQNDYAHFDWSMFMDEVNLNYIPNSESDLLWDSET